MCLQFQWKQQQFAQLSMQWVANRNRNRPTITLTGNPIKVISTSGHSKPVVATKTKRGKGKEREVREGERRTTVIRFSGACLWAVKASLSYHFSQTIARRPKSNSFWPITKCVLWFLAWPTRVQLIIEVHNFCLAISLGTHFPFSHTILLSFRHI